MQNLADRVRPVAARVAQAHGLEIFDVQFRREASGMVLRVQIDRPGPAATAEESVSVEDCAVVSRDLSAVLDVEDVIPTAYTLEVSSPGLDRPLRKAEDYRRFAGRLVAQGHADPAVVARIDEERRERELRGERAPPLARLLCDAGVVDAALATRVLTDER